MDRVMRKHIERALRVADFARQYRSDLPGHAAALGRLEEILGAVQQAVEQEGGFRRAAKAAIVTRQELGEELSAELRMLAGIARAAGRESVGTPIVLKFPGPKKNQIQFLLGARKIMAEAEKQEALLLQFGLPADHLATITAGLDRFAALLTERDAAARHKVGSRLRIRELARDLKAVVDQMHTINTFRFRHDPAKLGEWRLSRGVRIRSGKPGDELAEPGAKALPPGSPETGTAA